LFGSFDIGSVFGIRVRLHWSFVILIVMGILLGPFGNAWMNAVALAVLFGIVLLHELGHGVVARRFGLQVLDVTLWPLGGLTRMSRIPEDPKVEGWISFAGPAVNLALGFAALIFAPAGTLSDILRMQFVARGTTLENIIALFALANLTLAGFNLLPAFPLDGGRLTRALIALRTDWVQATLTTARIGKWIALATIGYGMYRLLETESGSILLPLFGVFLWFSGVRESWTVRMRHAGAEYARSMGVPVEPPTVATQPAAPVEADFPDDPSGARRPTILRAPQAPRRERMSEAEISALERFRGRIGKAQAPE